MAAFVSGYLAPGVYDRTLLDPNVASLLGGLRIPVIIGTGLEQILLLNQDLVRGSSSSIDNYSPNEDVSSQANGTNTVFHIRYYPIVTGDGSGTVTSRLSDVTVNVNNSPVPIVRVDGLNGLVTTQLPPQATDTVTILYHFKLTDTKVSNENISVQADGSNTTFYTANQPITDGRGNGTTTTSVTDVVVKVNGLVATVIQVSGVDGMVVLATAPLSTDVVTIAYWFNMYSYTFDLLPQDQLTTVVTVGDSPDLNNYTEGVDFIILDGNKIQWGAGNIITSLTHTSGSVYFDTTQISATLVDDLISLEDESTQIPLGSSLSSFQVKYWPIVDGSGRDIITFDPSKVFAFVNGTQVVVTRVDGPSGKVYLQQAVASDSRVQITYYRSELIDETYTFTVNTVGSAGTGTYSISTQAQGNLYNAKMTAYATTPTPSFLDPASGSMALNAIKANKNKAVAETVTVTFGSAVGNVVSFVVTSSLGANGSSGTGKTGTTYIDAVTGLQFTIATPTPPTYANGETITIVCSKATIPGTSTTGPFVTGPASPPLTFGSDPMIYSIPGMRITVSDTANTASGDTTGLQSFNHLGSEPAVGSTYYMSYYYQKTDFTPKIFTKFKDIANEYGPLDISNQITLSAFLMMNNGAVAVMCKQVLKAPNSNIAADETFITALSDMQKPVNGFKPRVIHVCTTSSTVISALTTHLATMSSELRRSERTAFIGFAVGTEPQNAAQAAQAIGYSRIVAVYPDGATISLTDEHGVSSSYVLDGSYLAAALAGLNVSSTYDVAEPMTRKTITGFTDLVRSLDEVEMDQVASAGVTVLYNDSGVIKVRHALTTDMSNPFVKAPNIVTIMDEVQIQARAALDQYIGTKFLDDTSGKVVGTLASALSALKEATIINAYTSVSAETDANDPNYLVAEAFYKPVFELSYIRVTFNIRAKL